MILKAIERGVSEDRLAAVLNVNPDNIRRNRRLLDGICADAASLLEDTWSSIASWSHRLSDRNFLLHAGFVTDLQNGLRCAFHG
jgi:hypothetical protein